MRVPPFHSRILTYSSASATAIQPQNSGASNTRLQAISNDTKHLASGREVFSAEHDKGRAGRVRADRASVLVGAPSVAITSRRACCNRAEHQKLRPKTCCAAPG